MNQKKKDRLDPDPPLSPDFPRIRHPDLADETKDVDEPANRDEVKPPGEEDVRTDFSAPEPPD